LNGSYSVGTVSKITSIRNSQESNSKVKKHVKDHPGAGNEGTEGEKKYSSTLSLTPTLDGFGWLRPRFTPKNEPVTTV